MTLEILAPFFANFEMVSETSATFTKNERQYSVEMTNHPISKKTMLVVSTVENGKLHTVNTTSFKANHEEEFIECTVELIDLATKVLTKTL